MSGAEALNFRMVRLAREKLELTQTVAASRACITQARLSRLESGQNVALSDVEIEHLAKALEVPPIFLTQPGTPAVAPLFRKRALRSTRKVRAIQARLNIAVLVAQRLLDAGVDLDAPQRFPEPGEFAADEPGLAAAALRRDWRFPAGPVDDLTEIIESAAGMVLSVDFGTTDATAAFIATRGDGRLWFLINSRESAGDRVRLSLAHELGHAVLHRLIPAADEAQVESDAFRFAAALLLPPECFDRAIPLDALTLQRARELKRTYGVSLQAIIRAAYDRGRISRSRYTSLYKQLSARQWRVNEPDAVALELPQLWPEVVQVHRVEHRLTDTELAAIAQVTPAMLGELFPALFTPPRPQLRSVTSSSNPMSPGPVRR